MASVTFPVTVGGNGSTVSDDSNASTGLANGGHRTRFVPALQQMVAVAQTVVSIGQSAVNASTNGGTSVTSLTIGTGSRTLTTQTAKTWFIGQFVIVANSASPINYMIGQITAYDSGSGVLTVNVTAAGGSGTYSAWTISVTALAVVAQDLFVPGRLGQGVATPLAGLHAYSAIVGGAPAASGSAADPNAVARFDAGGSVLDFGEYASGAFWFQARLASNYATSYDLYLNPNGGSVFTKSIRETRTAPTISAGALTLDCSASSVFAVSLNANITTLTLSNPPVAGYGYTMLLQFTADGTARTVTWPAAVKWPSGAAPTLTSANGKVDIFTLTTHDGGTNWYASTVGQNF
jgi:hypothetical protein